MPEPDGKYHNMSIDQELFDKLSADGAKTEHTPSFAARKILRNHFGLVKKQK